MTPLLPAGGWIVKGIFRHEYSCRIAGRAPHYGRDRIRGEVRSQADHLQRLAHLLVSRRKRGRGVAHTLLAGGKRLVRPRIPAARVRRVTTQAVEIRKGVFFRKEATIPLNRITDVRLHDDPLMRYFGLRGLRVETAGQSGPQAGSEGDLVGVVDAVEMRNAILLQRQQVLDAPGESTAPKAAPEGSAHVLTEIRDILARIEERLQSRDS